MKPFSEFQKELTEITRELSQLLQETQTLPGTGDHTFENWEKTCEGISGTLSEERLRAAVVGPIKSGKSTFVNALFKDDYLKRGAGVVTSIVTRIRKGEGLNAGLRFKSESDVNAEIDRALLLFPSADWRTETDSFDIHRSSDRVELSAALEALNPDLLIAGDSRNANFALLSSYLRGYDRVKEYLTDPAAETAYAGDDFEKHKDFTGDDALAVYLKDILLEIGTGPFDEAVEIADCQGSDSPNPLHLAMIQDYLRKAHLTVYVISSRTGLRQADIRFLTSIRKMGIMANTLFLINIDFAEHDSLSDLERVASRIREEIALFHPEPQIYILSALYNLFREKEDALSVKDRLRMVQWKGESDLAGLSDGETRRFEKDIRERLTNDRYGLLLKNHIGRLSVISQGFARWMEVYHKLLVQDEEGVQALLAGIRNHRTRNDRVKSMIRSTLDGALREIKQTLRKDVDQFFDKQDGVTGDVMNHIRNTVIDVQNLQSRFDLSGFSGALYLAFQEIRQSVDQYMVDTARPELFRFIREAEERIASHFTAIVGPFNAMIRETVEEYNRTLAGLGLATVDIRFPGVTAPSPDAAKEREQISLPPAAEFMNYTATLRSEAVLRRGVYRLSHFFRRLFKKDRPEDGKQGDFRALKDGVARLKKETEQSLLFHFKDYRENIKFQYLFKMADILSEQLFESLQDRLDVFVADLSRISLQLGEKEGDREQIAEVLNRAETRRKSLTDRLDALKQHLPSPEAASGREDKTKEDVK